MPTRRASPRSRKRRSALPGSPISALRSRPRWAETMRARSRTVARSGRDLRLLGDPAAPGSSRAARSLAPRDRRRAAGAWCRSRRSPPPARSAFWCVDLQEDAAAGHRVTSPSHRSIPLPREDHGAVASAGATVRAPARRCRTPGSSRRSPRSPLPADLLVEVGLLPGERSVNASISSSARLTASLANTRSVRVADRSDVLDRSRCSSASVPGWTFSVMFRTRVGSDPSRRVALHDGPRQRSEVRSR